MKSPRSLDAMKASFSNMADKAKQASTRVTPENLDSSLAAMRELASSATRETLNAVRKEFLFFQEHSEVLEKFNMYWDRTEFHIAPPSALIYLEIKGRTLNIKGFRAWLAEHDASLIRKALAAQVAFLDETNEMFGRRNVSISHLGLRLSAMPGVFVVFSGERPVAPNFAGVLAQGEQIAAQPDSQGALPKS